MVGPRWPSRRALRMTRGESQYDRERGIQVEAEFVVDITQHFPIRP